MAVGMCFMPSRPVKRFRGHDRMNHDVGLPRLQVRAPCPPKCPWCRDPRRSAPRPRRSAPESQTAVVSTWASGLAGLSYWQGRKYFSGSSRCIFAARRCAPSEPSKGSERTTLGPVALQASPFARHSRSQAKRGGRESRAPRLSWRRRCPCFRSWNREEFSRGAIPPFPGRPSP